MFKRKKHGIVKKETKYVKLKIDCTELDAAEEKVDRINSLLEEANSLAKEFSKTDIHINIKDVWEDD